MPTGGPPRPATGPSWRFVTVLVLATAVGPFAMQVFIPALPAIQDAFGVAPATAQLALSLSALSIAVATLFYGPLSDRFGRRPALTAGLVVYLAGSAASALATGVGTLILGRIVQAAGGCAGLVLTRAIVRDLYRLDEAAKVLAYVTMAMVVAPTVAPALGGLLTDALGWRSVFWAGALAGLAILVAVRAELAETAPPDRARARSGGGGGTIAGGFGPLLRSRRFLGYALQSAFSIGVFYAYLAAAPYVMQRVMGRPASEFGLLSILVSTAFMAGNLAAARLTRRVGAERMILVGSAGSLAATLLLAGLVAAGWWTPWAIFLPTSLAAFCQGWSLPNAQAAFVNVDPHQAGAASGLGGFLQMAVAAAAAQAVGSVQDGTPYPMAAGMAASAAAALLAALAARARAGGRHP